MKNIYADYNATAIVKKKVKDSLVDWVSTYFGNPSSLHQPGQSAKHQMEAARSLVAKAMGALPAEIIFVSGGTESNVLGLLGLALQNKNKIKKVLVSSIEHSAILGQIDLIKSLGLEWAEIPVLPNGVVDLVILEKLVDKQPVLVSVMLANNETGVIQPISEIVKIVKQFNGLIHCDAVQAFGKIEVDVKELGVDTLSISGHKIGALRGIGALYVKKGLVIKSVFGKGAHEREMRPGTENLIGILSLGQACESFADWSLLIKSRQQFEAKLLSQFNVKIAGYDVLRIPNTVSVSFKGANKDLLLVGLDLKGIAASAGSACKASLSLPSHVLKAMGYSPEELAGVIRFSFGPETTSEDFDYIIKSLGELLNN